MRKTFFVLALTVALLVAVVPVSAQVPAPGGPYNTGFTIQNLETQAATCVFSLYDATGAAKYTSGNLTVPQGGSYFTYVGSLSVASGQYSAVVSCDRQVAAVANTTGSNNASSYSGIGSTQTATTLYAPGVYKNYAGYNSNIVVQNTTGSPINITLTIYNGSTQVDTETRSNVPANASVSFDQSTRTALGNGLFAGKITATGAVAAEVNIWNSAGQLFAYNPFSSGALTAYAPVLMNGYFGFNTALTVQNVDTASANVTVTYSNGKTSTGTIAGGASKLFYTPNEGLPAGWLGSAKITSTGGNIVALVNESNNVNRAASYEGFKTGGTKANAPIVLRKYFQYSTSITCQNISGSNTATNITAKYSNGVTEVKSSVPANGTALFYQPNTTGLPDGFNGSAVISSSGQPIVCVVNENQVSNTAAQDWQLSYDAIVQ